MEMDTYNALIFVFLYILLYMQNKIIIVSN